MRTFATISYANTFKKEKEKTKGRKSLDSNVNRCRALVREAEDSNTDEENKQQ